MEVKRSVSESAGRFIESVGKAHEWLTVLWDGDRAAFYGSDMSPIVEVEWYVAGAMYGQEYIQNELYLWEARRENLQPGQRDVLAMCLGYMILRGIKVESQVAEVDGVPVVHLRWIGRHGTPLLAVQYDTSARTYVCTYVPDWIKDRFDTSGTYPNLVPIWRALLNKNGARHE